MHRKTVRAKVRESLLHVIDAALKQPQPITPPESPDVASLIVLKEAAATIFASEMETQHEHGNIVIQHAVYVTADGGQIVTGTGERGGFSFLVPAGGWNWIRPLM